MQRGLVGVVVLVLSVGLWGCGAKREVQLTAEDRALASATGLPESLVLEAKKQGDELRRLEGINDEGDPTQLAGVTIDIPHRDSLEAAKALQEAAPPGYFAFVSERNFGFGGEGDWVSVMKAADPYEVILAMGTNGWNYDISPAMVASRLKEWDERFGLVFRGIGFDWLEAEFKTPPADMQAFAEEVYKFCPDVVDQGTDTVEALAREMKSENMVYLWWD